jgi:hypothetical protein
LKKIIVRCIDQSYSSVIITVQYVSILKGGTNNSFPPVLWHLFYFPHISHYCMRYINSSFSTFLNNSPGILSGPSIFCYLITCWLFQILSLWAGVVCCYSRPEISEVYLHFLEICDVRRTSTLLLFRLHFK